MTKTELLLEIGKNAKQRQQALGLSIEELAEKANIGYSFCSAIIQGRKAMSIETFHSMALALETSADNLLFGESSRGACVDIASLLEGMSQSEIKSIERLIRLCKAEFMRKK